MKITSRFAFLVSITLSVIAGKASPAHSQDRQSGALGATTLIVVASETAARINTNEFIVLRSSDEGVLWTATATQSESKNGKVDVRNTLLPKVFERVKSLKEAEAEQRRMEGSQPYYSLVLIDERGVQTLGHLNRRQQAELGKSDALRPVFDNILRAGSYAKADVMLDLVLPAGALRATIKAPPGPRESEIPPFRRPER